jgi:hypothetical protein
MFRANRTLLHVDISYNQIKSIDKNAISEGLMYNHSVLGLHMNGNEGLGLDTKGQVVAMEQPINPVIIRIRPDMKIGVISK